MPGRREMWDSQAKGEKEPGKSGNRSGCPPTSVCEEQVLKGGRQEAYESGPGLKTQARRSTQWLSARRHAVLPGAVS